MTLFHLQENWIDFIWLIHQKKPNLEFLDNFEIAKYLFLQHY